ncbi:fibronectin type III domain-containing protein [Flavobacterium soli]|uniref:fibronectin type III domain-containing protein n=1 Tax=Flavobacterium soli TaxID=344881 RepID=UPI0003FDD3DA|nr:fibronectin type III domain-containing protein [Flavobacterium soli]
MKKITILSAFLLLLAWGSHAQCIRTALYPSNTVVSNNLGLPQTITTGAYTSEYSQVSGLIEGNDYVFTCALGTTNKYLTITDFSNNVIAFGDSPLTVEAITSTQVRMHYSDNAECASTSSSHLTTVMAILDCSPPLDLTASDITTTSAVLSWEPMGEETAWQVYVVPTGSPAPTADTAGEDVADNPSYTDSTLEPASTYQFYVRAMCGDESSPWNGPFTFVSACEQIDEFSENFDTYAYAAIPTCWAQVRNGDGASTSSYARVADWNFNSPSRSGQIYNANTGTEANIIMVAPEVSNLAAGTHRLKFFAKTGGGVINVQFGTVDNTTEEAVFTELDNIDITGTYTEYAVDYTVYEGTDNFIAIRHNGAQYTSVFFDDVRWEVAPLCADVSDIAFGSITDSEALVTWEPNGAETQWDVVYGETADTDPDALTPISPAPTGTPEATLSGLADNTTYKVWVRSVCGEDLGVWVGPKTFKTSCVPTDSLEENFDTYAYGTMVDCWTAVKSGTGVSQYAYAQVTDWNFYSPSRTMQLYNSDSQATANVMVVSPALTNIGAGTQRVKFFAKSGGSTGSLQVGTIDNATTDGTFTEVLTIPLTSTHTEFAVEFTDTGNTDMHIAFRYNTPGMYNSIFIDNVLWEVIPSCGDVTEITVVESDVETASLTWTPGGDETQWDVVFGETADTDPDALTPISPAPTGTPEATITGLADNTNYKVWVRSVCGDENGAWIGPITFKTPCLPTDTIDENFDAIAYAGMPDCWAAIKGGTGVSQYAYVQVLDYNFNTPSRSMGLYNSDSAAGANIMLASPNLENLSLGTYRVKFFARSSGSTGSVQVGTVDNTTSDAVFTEMETVAITSTYTEYAVNFTPSEDNFIAFRFNTPGTYNTVFLDDIRWEIAPLCADVANVDISEITTETAYVTWEAQGSETNWQVVYGSIDDTDPTGLTPSPLLTSLDYTIDDLTENTGYNVWVRSACGEPNGNGMWMGPFAFYTQCLATTVPYTQDFESSTTPAMPNCSVTENAGTGNNWTTASQTLYGFNSKVLQYLYTCSSAANAWYYTQGIALTAGQEYSLSFLYGSNSTNYVEKLKVMYGTSPTSADMTEEIVDHDAISFNVAETSENLFTAPETAVYYFGFNIYSASCQYNLYIDDIAIEASLSNQDFDNADFTFYPNPVKDVLNLSYDQAMTNVAVFNILGQKVIESAINANATQVDMSNLAAGSYLVKVTSDNQTKTIKVIKQ